METRLIFLLLIFCFTTKGFTQQANHKPLEVNLKYGKPSNEELKMTSYEPDTSATAVILYRKGVTKYTYQINNFGLVTDYTVRLKILKPSGTQYADVIIPYYSPDKRLESKDDILEAEACSYNLENGKIVKTKTKREFIVRERINDKYMQLKFSIPMVRVGTVIEYHYRKQSDFYYHIDNWVMQDEIPVLYSEYDIDFPLIFDYNAEMRGADKIKVEEKKGSLRITVTDGATGIAQVKHDVTCVTRHINFSAQNLPALKDDEAYLWCADDYKVQVSFELKGVQYPGSAYKPYTQTWENIDDLLLKDPDFGERLSLPNPYRTEMKLMQLSTLDTKERIGQLFRLLKQKMAWNGRYALYSPDLERAQKQGTGSNADLNFTLLSMLREAGLNAYPVVISRRDIGILPVTYPSVQKLNTFIIGVKTSNTDSTYVFIDSSMGDNSYLNTLPPSLMTARARIIGATSGKKWVDLSKISSTIIWFNIQGTIATDGSISGVRSAEYSGQAASKYRTDFFAAKDSTAFIEQQAAQNGCIITQYRQTGVRDFTPSVKESLVFTKPAGSTNDKFIYINPMVFTHIDKNIFTQTDRQLPIELPYGYSFRIVTTLNLPESYSVEELPKPLSITLEDKGITCQYTANVTGGKINMSYIFNQNNITFSADQYQQLQTIWEAIAEKNNEMIILKKNL